MWGQVYDQKLMCYHLKITKSTQITIQWYGLATPVLGLVNHRATQQYPELSISSYVIVWDEVWSTSSETWNVKTVILYQWLDNLLT
jgi:hypothetical protein